MRFGPVVSGQDTAHHILVDLDSECQRDLLGNARTAPAGVPPFHCDDGVDEFLVRSLGAGSTTHKDAKTASGTFVSSTPCAGAARWRGASRWRNGGCVSAA